MSKKTDLYDAMRQQLALEGSCIWTGPEGKRLFLIAANILAMDTDRGLLIAYEGEGTMFFELDRPLNVYRLLSAGFSVSVAATLADVVNELCGLNEDNVSGAVPLLMLPSEPAKGT